MTTTHVSFDLETWGTEPGCDIRSIGACVFDPVAGWGNGQRPAEVFYIATHNPRGHFVPGGAFNETGNPKHDLRYNLRRDPATVKWWSEQSDEAQAAFADPVMLDIALSRFAVWLAEICPDVTQLRLWSHGPAFDPPILAAAYKAVGFPVPWHYRAPRDTRTAFDMAGIDDHSAWLNQHLGPLGVSHHALDDAICQARAVCGAWARVAGWRAYDEVLANDQNNINLVSTGRHWTTTGRHRYGCWSLQESAQPRSSLVAVVEATHDRQRPTATVCHHGGLPMTTTHQCIKCGCDAVVTCSGRNKSGEIVRQRECTVCSCQYHTIEIVYGPHDRCKEVADWAAENNRGIFHD